MQFQHIQIDPRQWNGEPFIAGTRLTVEYIAKLHASGLSHEAIVALHPRLSLEAVQEALQYVQARRRPMRWSGNFAWQ